MTSAAPSKSLAVIAFLVSLLGVCFFPICAIGGVLALVDAIRQRGQPKAPGFDFRGSAFALNGFSFLVGLCMVPSLPGFWAFQQRSKQSQCRRDLQAVMKKFDELQEGAGARRAEAAARDREGSRGSRAARGVPRLSVHHRVRGEHGLGRRARRALGVVAHALRPGPTRSRRRRMLPPCDGLSRH
jgi:hypothetical protein